MGNIYWFGEFITGYNIVKYMAVLFILGQLIALRNRDVKLSIHLQYSFISSFAGVYLLNYLLFLITGADILYSTLLLELILTTGIFFYSVAKYLDRQEKVQQKQQDQQQETDAGGIICQTEIQNFL